MKIIPQKNLPDIYLPLPIFNSIHIADAIGQDGQEFGVYAGLEEKYAEQLKAFSSDERDLELQKNTHDMERFAEGLYEEWYAKNRTPFALIHKQSDSLSALVWFGPEPLYENEDGWQTAAWRSYGPFRKKGLMKNFTEFAMNIYAKSIPGKFWIGVRPENTASIRLAEELGFYPLEEASDEESLIMVK